MSAADTGSNTSSQGGSYTGAMRHRLLPILAALVLAGAAEVRAETARVIVAFKPEAAALREQPMSAGQPAATAATRAERRASRLAGHAGVALGAGRALGARSQVVVAEGLTSDALAARLASHPEVAYAVVDHRRRWNAAPTDPLYDAGPASGLGPAVGQWYLRAPTATVASAINAEAAWDLVTGTASTVVAVLDTGVLATHPDLAGAVLDGYDMIADTPSANDGNGRDANATDPGDWVSSADTRSAAFRGCTVEDSSWHGTQVSGIIGAVANNGLGIAGAAHGVRILPVRVLGKCGGYDSDIQAGMYWAAGIDQDGLAGSATPARVINMSLGGGGACDSAYAETVAAVRARGAVIVAAAGNSTGHSVGTPANCAGVIGVAGLRHAGSKVGFSDLGPEITISAPGGNCINIGAGEPCLYPIATTSNSGTREPAAAIYTDSYNHISVGTSFSTPLVSAVVALMVTARPSLTPDEITLALQLSARPFPTTGADNGSDPAPVAQCRAPDGTDQLQCYCVTGLCGAGMLDAQAAVQAVLRPLSSEETARQLLDYAERQYPQLFPNRLSTQSSPPFLYRYHPSTGLYVGVAVTNTGGYVQDGVYVMGGSFGAVPRPVGRVRDYISPRAVVAP